MSTVWKRIKTVLMAMVLAVGMCGCASSSDKDDGSTFAWLIGTAVVVTGLMMLLGNNETDIIIDASTREYEIERHVKKLVREQTKSLIFIEAGTK